jgi:UV DNA damage endonuclease
VDRIAQPLGAIGRRFRAAGIRVSTHPGQFTVLNSPNPAIVKAAVALFELVPPQAFDCMLEAKQEDRALL